VYLIRSLMITEEAVAIGGTRQLRWIIRTLQGEEAPARPVTWSSSNPAAVEVDANGVLHGVGPGQAVITGSAENARSAEFTVTATRGFTSREIPFTALRVNDRGQVVGHRYENGRYNVILWEDGVERPIGIDFWTQPALVINAAGQVAGSGPPALDAPSRGFFWNGTQLVEIAPPDPAHALHVTALGDDGTVYGRWLEPGQPTRGDAFSWKDGAFTVLGRFGGDHARIADVNARGELLITVWPQYQAFILRDGVRTDIAPGEGMAISEEGDLVIQQGANSLIRWNGAFYELVADRHQGYYVRAINAEGDAVGSFVSGPTSMAILWRRGTLFNPAHLVADRDDQAYTSAVDISESGMMLVHGVGPQLGVLLLVPM
jgi:hypothetical protein